jgi:hypothetical protein
MKTLLVATFVGLASWFIYTKLRIYINAEYIKSNTDGREYLVRNTVNKQQAADTLGMINIKIQKLIEILKSGGNREYADNVALLVSRYSPSSLMENTLLYDTAYTINKGETVAVCLTTRDSAEHIYDLNTLMFVMIHELAHVGVDSVGHDEKFKKFFTYLLKTSIDHDVWIYQDYTVAPVEYCGMFINTSPIQIGKF